MRVLPAQQTSLTSGELSASLLGRIDVSRYYAGAQRLENVLVVPQGGVKRRPGLRHIGQLDDGLDGVRLIPFAFNTEQTYVLALTAGKFRVWRSDGTLLATGTDAPWTAAQAARMNRAQSADTLLLTHPDMAPQRIRRGTLETTWTRDAVPWTNIPTFDFGSGAEALMSSTRGWPQAVTFYQGRLWIGGFRSRPATLLSSKVADFFNLGTGTALDDEAIYVTIDSDQVNAIRQLSAGRTLQVFTSGAEFAVNVAPPVTPKNVAFEEQTRRGIEPFVPLAELDGAQVFVQRGGTAIRQFLFGNVEAAYSSELVSLLAPHLIRQPRELAARKGQATDDADHVLLVNADGSPSVLTMLRAQEIIAFTRWTTQGQVLSACALQSGQVFLAVLRNGSVRLELWDDACLTDGAVRQTSGAPFSSMSGLAHLNGLTCQVVVDGAYLGTVVPSGGSATLPRAAAQWAEIGLGFTPRITSMPIEPRDPAGSLIGRKCRIVEATARITGTGLFELRGQPVVLRRLGSAPAAPLDSPPPLTEQDVTLRGLAGWRERHALEIAQSVPGPFHLLALAYRIGVAG